MNLRGEANFLRDSTLLHETALAWFDKAGLEGGGPRVYSSFFMNDASRLREFDAFLYQQILIARTMEVRVAKYDGRQLRLVAPIAPNHNHLGTAFGGSLGAIAMLAGYSFLWLELQDLTRHLVVRGARSSFRRPVREEIIAICRRPNENDLLTFKSTLTRNGKARIGLDVTIEEGGSVAVEFQGSFVALKKGNTTSNEA